MVGKMGGWRGDGPFYDPCDWVQPRRAVENTVPLRLAVREDDDDQFDHEVDGVHRTHAQMDEDG